MTWSGTGARRLARCRPIRSCNAASPWCPRGAGSFPSLTVEENLKIGGQVRKGRRAWTLDRDLCPLPDPEGTPPIPRHGPVGRPAADGRHRPRADVEPRASAVRRDQPWPCPVVIRDIYAALPRIKAGRDAALVIVEQDIGRALAVADRVYCMMEGRVTLTGPGKGRDARGDPRRLFRRSTHDGAEEAGACPRTPWGYLGGEGPPMTEPCASFIFAQIPETKGLRSALNLMTPLQPARRHDDLARRPSCRASFSAGSTRSSPAGLSLVFGIMRLVNLAHGDLIVFAAYRHTGDRRRHSG
jgi:hypothetical protein